MTEEWQRAPEVQALAEQWAKEYVAWADAALGAMAHSADSDITQLRRMGAKADAARRMANSLGLDVVFKVVQLKEVEDDERTDE